MANRLYPPILEGTIPAFYGNILKVPFSHNRSVSNGAYTGFTLKVKSIQSNSFIGTARANKTNNSYVLFDITDLNLKPGMSYKIQIAYIDNDNIDGYYSNVGVVKYTYQPTVEIDNLTIGLINYGAKIYYGKYTNDNDPTERVYSYEFIIRDLDGNVIETSGKILHDSTLDTYSGGSVDIYYLTYNLDANEIYTIEYRVITTNDMVVSSPKYKVGNYYIDAQYEFSLNAELNFDNGYVDVVASTTTNATGLFVIARKDLTVNGHWEDVDVFALSGTSHTFRDFYVLQGHEYIYSIQQFNTHNLYTERTLSNKVYADFEDAFLFDGKRQLKIRFNPKVSSFKTTLLESKTDTIGGKYPFIFRNGNTYYKEFPISGLISYWMDNDELFMTNEELDLVADNYSRLDNPAVDIDTAHLRTYNLVSYNMSSERTFKLAVLDWLNDGKIKLFRSPGEGNYLVRLLNNSLTPTDSLGRMLHTFSSTAYELYEYSTYNLAQLGFLNISQAIENFTATQSQVKTLSIIKPESATGWVDLLNGITATGFVIEDLMPGTPIQIFIDGEPDPIVVHIGTTGSYIADGLGKIVGIQIPADDFNGPVHLTIQYEEPIINHSDFALIDGIEGIGTRIKTFTGSTENIINEIEDIRTSIVSFIDLQFELKPIIDVYNMGTDNNYYLDIFKQQELTTHMLPGVIYRKRRLKNSEELSSGETGTLYSNYLSQDAPFSIVVNHLDTEYVSYDNNNYASNNIYFFDRNKNDYFEEVGEYIISDTGETINASDYNPSFTINYNDDDSIINLTDRKRYHIQNTDGIKSITLGNGVILNAVYQDRRVIYAMENSSELYPTKYDGFTVAEWKQQYEDALANMSDETSHQIVKNLYIKFIDALTKAVDDYKKEMGME